MPVPKEVIDAQLRAILTPEVQPYYTKKEVQYLPEVVQPGEVIHALVSGMRDNTTWLVVATNHRVLFLDKGLIGGLKQLELPLAHVSGIAHSVGLMFGEVAIGTGAASWRIVNIAPKQAAKRFADRVSGLLQARAAPVQAAPASTDAEDFVSRLERLGKLRDSGVLSESEFQAQKQRILSGG